MAKTPNDSQLIKAISSSQIPLTIDQIAASVDSLRHKINPMLRGLVSSGQIVEVPPTGEFPVIRFTFRQGAGAVQDLPTDNVIQLTSSRRKEDEAPPADAPSDEPTAKRMPRRTRSSLKVVEGSAKAPAATEIEGEVSAAPSVAPAPKPASVTHSKAPAARAVSESEAVSGGASPAKPESLYNQVLRMLGKAPETREHILSLLGPVEDLLGEMVEKGVILSDFLFDAAVHDLTEAGRLELKQLPELPGEPAPEIAKAVVETPAALVEVPEVLVLAAEEPVPAAVSEPVAEVVPSSKVVDTPRRAEEQVNLPLSEPVVQATEPTPAPIVSEPAVPSPVVTAEAQPENPIMVEMAALMERLVNERMGKLTAKLEQGERDREALVKVGASIKKATAALQVALDALNEIGDSIA